MHVCTFYRLRCGAPRSRNHPHIALPVALVLSRINRSRFGCLGGLSETGQTGWACYYSTQFSAREPASKTTMPAGRNASGVPAQGLAAALRRELA
jgi:hypothetical protein